MPNPPKEALPALRQARSRAEHAPFCSRGCKDRDLLKWLGEGYRIPGPPADRSQGWTARRATVRERARLAGGDRPSRPECGPR